jgi:hypothetical protein
MKYEPQIFVFGEIRKGRFQIHNNYSCWEIYMPKWECANKMIGVREIEREGLRESVWERKCVRVCVFCVRERERERKGETGNQVEGSERGFGGKRIEVKEKRREENKEVCNEIHCWSKKYVREKERKEKERKRESDKERKG